MGALVVYYSRTGVTKKIAHKIKKEINCDVEEIKDLKDREGLFGYLVSCKDAVLGDLPRIRAPRKDPSKYNMTIVGTPVWVGNSAPPVISYLTKNRRKFNKVAFFCTQGSKPGSRHPFEEMRKACGRKPVTTMGVQDAELDSGNYEIHVRRFLGRLKRWT